MEEEINYNRIWLDSYWIINELNLSISVSNYKEKTYGVSKFCIIIKLHKNQFKSTHFSKIQLDKN